jgi:hypothetical protein
MKPVNLAEKLSTFTDHWQPRTGGEFNGHDLAAAGHRRRTQGLAALRHDDAGPA